MDRFMSLAKQELLKGVNDGDGGPFGAVIINANGNVVASGHNMVLKNNDPTAHAEITVIREACKALNTHSLKGYKLYTTCEPCPMCLSAIIWANIDEVYYACTRSDAESIGFRDNEIYEHIKGNKEMIKLNRIDEESCIEAMRDYKKGLY